MKGLPIPADWRPAEMDDLHLSGADHHRPEHEHRIEALFGLARNTVHVPLEVSEVQLATTGGHRTMLCFERAGATLSYFEVSYS